MRRTVDEGMKRKGRSSAAEIGGYGLGHSLGGRRQALGWTQAQTKHRQTGNTSSELNYGLIYCLGPAGSLRGGK